MLTSFKARCLFIAVVLIATIGIGVAYPLITSRKSATILNASPRLTVATLKSFLPGGVPKHVSLSSAADGTIDSAFNAGGAGPNSDVLAVAMQSDGKIVIGGFFTSYNGDALASDRVMRLNVDGTRDTTFNAGGAGANTTVYAVAVQPDGKILIGGQFTSYNGDAAASDFVMRLHADGTRDTTFNAGGAGANDYVFAFAVQPDGKILVGGNFFTYNGNPTSGRVMRLNSDGTRDTTFNTGGLGANGTVSAVAVQPDGKIIIGGLFTSYNGDVGASDYVMRLNADGTRDTSFNPGGTGTDNWVQAIAIQPDGKIVIGGDFTGYNGDSGASDKVMRLNADGTRDATFNTGGTGADTTVDSVAMQPDGKVIIGGLFTSYNGDFGASNYVMRLNTDGKPDTTFNLGGAGASALVDAVAVQSDGKIVIGGKFTSYNGDFAAPDYLLRLFSTPAPVCSRAPDRIISWWPGEGNAQDIVGHYDGTLQNGATFGAGMVGQGFSLDGIDDAIVVNNNPALNPTSITVEAWIKPDSVPVGTLKDVVTKWGFDATIDSYFLGLLNSGGVVRVIGAIGDGATGDSGFSGGTVTLNTWSHIAMTYDAASGLNRLYLNGVPVSQRVRANGIYPTTSRVFIGREDSNNNRFFSGLIDEPTIYSRALTDAEILAIYNAGSNGKCAVPPTPNTNPTITAAAGLARQQGSAATNSQIASVNDAETAPGNLTVTVTSVPAGISVTNIVNTGGAITADISADCTAATGNKIVVLQVSDGSLTANDNLILNVTPNSGPTLTYVSPQSVTQGNSLTINPTTGPSDNGSISSITVQSSGTFTGGISVNNVTGAISITNAVPVGSHTITIRTTDNCGGFTDATFTLEVTSPPSCINNPIVTTNADSGQGSLRQAVMDACSGSTIAVADSVTSPVVLFSEIALTKDLNIQGPLSNLLTVSGGQSHRIFVVASGANVTLQQLRLADGAAVFFSGTSPLGGGILNSGTLTLINSIVANNVVTGSDDRVTGRGKGGGIYNDCGTVNIKDSKISDNTAYIINGRGAGGGIFNEGGIVNVTNSVISGNSGGEGGGIYNNRGGTVTVTDSTVSGNRAVKPDATGPGVLGGGIFNGNDQAFDLVSHLVVSNSTISGNVAGGFGGGIFNSNGGFAVGNAIATVTNTTLSANVAAGGFLPGGAFIAGGGGIYNDSNAATINIKNTIVAGNSGPDVKGTGFNSQGYNLIGTTESINGFTQPTDLTGTLLAPLDPMLGPLQDNGGLTLTHALLPGSPAIDKGAAATDAGNPISTDQRGISRPFENPFITNADNGNGSDIGAFELDVAPPTADVAITKTASPNPVTVGGALTYTLNVRNDGPSDATNVKVTDTLPAGVTFNSATPSQGTCTKNGGDVTCDLGSLANGNSAAVTIGVTLNAGGDISNSARVSATEFDPNLANNTSTVTTTVNKINTDTSVSLSPDTSVYGQSVTFTATVTPTTGGAGTPTGTVQFYADKGPISGPQDLIGGVAVLTTNISSVGGHLITATYSGDSGFNGSVSKEVKQKVSKAKTFTLITSHTPLQTVVGQPYTVSFTVGADAPSTAIPFGTVTVTDGTGQSCIGSLTEEMGSCVITSTTVGVKSLSAAYSGGTNFSTSGSATTTHSVFPASTTTTISTSPSPSYFGLAVTLQANVTAVAPGGGTPTGIVTFMDGRRVLATVPLATGQASFTTSSLTVGTHTIVASYSGDLNYNGSFGSTSHQVLMASLTSGFILPNNGGWVLFSVTRTAGQLTGSLTYFRDTYIFSGTKVTSLVISGQMARIEGFSSNGQLFVATAYDGGPGPLDGFRLWIEGVELTAGGAIVGGNVLVQPWGPDTRLKGWVDLHTHPMSNLAFGGKLFHGAPDVGSLMPAVQMPYDAQCRFDNRATSIAEALSQDGPTHGPPTSSSCGDFGRWTIILALEAFNDAAVQFPQAVGYPSFANWPKWDDITHQKMWIDWIRRDWEGGLRVMVALSHNNRMLAEVVGVNGGGPISGAKNDKASSDLQIEEIKKLVAAHSDFMAIARSSAELQSIVQGGRLAVVLGVEIDKIGDFNTGGGVTEQTVDDEIARLYNQGVRYIFPIHLTDNAFGDTAIYKTLFNIANFRENGSFWTVGCGLESDEVGFRSTAFPPVLNPFIPPGSPQPPRAPDCLIPKPNGPLFVGHVNARTPNGLTSLGEFAIKSMMKRGMIIDIDHMSDRAANRALTLANFSGGGYPLMSGHTGIRDRNSADLNAENARTKAQLAQVACLGGMFGVGTDGFGAFKWAAAYAEVYDVMRRAFAPGGACPQATPLGVSFVGLGTDMNSLVRTPPPTILNPFEPPRFTDIYNPNNPINAGLPPLSKSTTGSRTWDYNFDGVAHYGMYVDFLRDVRTWGGNATLTGKQIVDDQVMYGAENFYRMWLKAEAQKTRVP